MPRRYAGLSPTERDEERQRRLHQAGLELFGTIGFHHTSIQGICSEAHVTARHFYQSFPSTEALFRQVYDDLAETCLRKVVQGLAVGATPAARIRSASRTALTFLLEDPRRARVQCIESHAVSPSFSEHRSKMLRRYAQLLADQGRALGAVPASDMQMRLTTVALVAGADSIVAESLHDRTAIGIDNCSEALSQLLCAAAGVGR